MRSIRPILSRCAATLLVVGLHACGGGQGTATEADDCWGRTAGGSAADCRDALADDAAALGLVAAPAGRPPALDSVGRHVGADSDSGSDSVSGSGSGAVVRHTDSDSPARHLSPAPDPPAATDLETTPETESAEPPSDEVLASPESGPAADPTALQLSAIAAFNARESGWQARVEEALAHPELQNAPNLAFAGLEAAYERRRYGDVLARADVVWANLDKGYLQGDEQRTFVTEMACRAGFQRHMQGTTSASHARWCGYWVERLERSGADATEARELLGQVE